MSSHHFVKEQQEPAVFIFHAENTSFLKVADLLEWVPTVLVSEAALDQVLSWGIKIDVILASPEFQRNNQHLLESQYPVKFLGVLSGNYLEEGLQYLLATKHESVNLVGMSHRNTPDLEKNLEFMDICLFDGDWKYYPIKTGKLKKWFTPGVIHLHGEEELAVEIRNSSGHMILPITYTTMVEVPEGTTEISSKGLFWIGENIG